MGRPLQPPTITPNHRKDGTVRSYLVTATIGGKQRKKIRSTLALAKELAAKWQGCRDESIQHLPTHLIIAELRAGEAWISLCKSLNETPENIILWTAKNFQKPGQDRWEDAIEEFRQSRRRKHRLKEGDPDTSHIGNLLSAIRDFAAHVGRETIGTPTLKEVEAWLATRGGTKQLVGDFRSFCLWWLTAASCRSGGYQTEARIRFRF